MKLTSIHARALPHTSFLLLLIAAFSLRNDTLVAVYALAALFVLLKNIAQFQTASNTERSLMLFFSACITVMLPISTLRSWTALIHYCVALLSLGAAFVLTRDRNLLLLASKYSLLAALGAVLSALAITGLSDFPLENMIPNSSSNGITSYLIVLQVNYGTLKFLMRRRASLLTSLLTLFICIVGYGRGSILASTAIVAVNLLSYLSWKRDGRSAAGILLTICMIGLVYFSYADQVADFIESNTKIGSGLIDEPRQRILNDYLQKIDGLSALIGADYDGTSIESDFNGNPHNSFVRAHHIFGALYLLSLAAFPLALLRKRLPRPVQRYAASMLFIVLFRAATEPILFPTIFDFYFFALFFALNANTLPNKFKTGTPAHAYAASPQ